VVVSAYMTLMVARFSAYGATLDTLLHVARIFAERNVVGSALTTDCASSDSKTRDGHRRPRHDCALLFFSTSFTDEQATQGHSPYVFFSCMALVGASLLPDSSSKASMNRAIPSSRRATGWSQAPWPNTGRHTPRHVYRGDPTQTLEQSMMSCTPDGSVSKRCDD